MGYFEKQEKVEIVLKKLSLSLLLVSSALMAEESEATKARNMTYLATTTRRVNLLIEQVRWGSRSLS